MLPLEKFSGFDLGTSKYKKKRADFFALSIYGLVIFPKALGHTDDAILDLFDRLDKKVTLVPTILAETFRSLSAYRRAGEGRFIRCAQLLLAWFYSYFWEEFKVGETDKKVGRVKDVARIRRRRLEVRSRENEKGKNKAEKDLDNLKIDYKKLRLSMKTTSHNSSIELKASLNNIEELNGKIEELDATLKNCELRVELLETNNEHYKEELQRFQGQIRDRDHIIGETVTQV
ncbi:hypothetical protein Goari_024354 [Gossypium aridum]|uniref:DUF7745 domain-containing protein n=1 Tax=Gossypium aridum TaxID=34290 RepID=A0A7J8X6U3_GOSAI|nr:hypothetical protein [Gossypium aridum]